MPFQLRKKTEKTGLLTLCETAYASSSQKNRIALLSDLAGTLRWNTETVLYYITLLYKKQHKMSAEVIMNIITGLKQESSEVSAKINELRRMKNGA